MKIYKNEKDLAKALMDNNVVSYVSQAKAAANTEFGNKLIDAVATAKDLSSKDLYPVTSLLVSSVWNKNDDVFLKEEIWAARHTPRHHPTNINHDQNNIVGHMVEVWATDDDNNVLQDTLAVEELPEMLHLVNSSVIYTHWRDDERSEEVLELINDIEEDRMFVSMECVFPDFDYGVMDASGNMSIVGRDEETSFLTKHLRAYGGDGQFEGHKIGRVIKNMVFYGKGYVKNPANERSVIFNRLQDAKANVQNSLDKVYMLSLNGVQLDVEIDNSMENNTMADEAAQKELGEARKTISDLQTQIKNLQKEVAEAGANKLQEQIDSLTSELDAAKAENGTLKELEKENDSLKEKVAELDKTSKAEAIKHKTMLRQAELIAIGIKEKAAREIAEAYLNLTDDQWKPVFDTYAIRIDLEMKRMEVTRTGMTNDKDFSDYNAMPFLDRYNGKFRYMPMGGSDMQTMDMGNMPGMPGMPSMAGIIADIDPSDTEVETNDEPNTKVDEEPTELEVIQAALASLLNSDNKDGEDA